jgi:hypothetical protein
MKLFKVGDCYLNLENVTHAEFVTSSQGLAGTVFFNCQITDDAGGKGVQATKTFVGADARSLKAWMDLRLNAMEQHS